MESAVLRVAAVVAAGALATGCGGGSPAPRVTVTVTVTPEASKGVRGARPDSERSIAGRRFDVGTIVATRGSGARQVLVLDRWSVRGVAPEAVAGNGIAVVPENGNRFRNENVDKLYDVPVGDEVRVVINQCLPAARPGLPAAVDSRPATLGEFLSLPDRTNVVAILSYAGGRLVRLETSPRCPVRVPTAAASAAPSAAPSAGPGSPGPGTPPPTR
jgi:hypothetical protein